MVPNRALPALPVDRFARWPWIRRTRRPRLVIDGIEYWLCSPRCGRLFEEDPRRTVRKPDRYRAQPEGHGHHELPTSGGALTNISISRDAALPDRLCHRRDPGSGHRHRARAIEHRDGGPRRRARLRLRLLPDERPVLRAGLRAERRAFRRVRLGHFSISVMELVDNAFVVAIPGAMDAGLSSAAVLGHARLAFHRVRSRRPGQPLADRSRKGTRGGPPDRRTRRPEPEARRRACRRGLLVRLGDPAGRVDVAPPSTGVPFSR